MATLDLSPGLYPDPSSFHLSIHLAGVHSESCSELGTVPGAGEIDWASACPLLLSKLWALDLGMQWWESSLAEASLSTLPHFFTSEAV